MPATLDGLPIFGTAYTFVPIANPRQSYDTSQFGENGIGTQDGGARGGRTVVTGLLSGYGPIGLAQAEAQVRALNDGRAHVLVDNLGVEWPDVLLHSFRPTGPAIQSSAGVWARRYVLTLLHLS